MEGYGLKEKDLRETNMLIEVRTADGPRKVRVCDYCKTVCIPSGRYCSGHCARNDAERRIEADKMKIKRRGE